MPKLIHSPQPHSGERRNPDEFSAHSYIQSWHKQFTLLAEDSNALQRMELVFGFFSAFSRAEFALKKCGYIVGKKDAKANWDEFSEKIESSLKDAQSHDPALDKAVEYITDLTTTAPKKQIVTIKPVTKIKSPKYEDPATPANPPYPLTYVCRIRNNLFHGGKTINGPMIEERDENLLIYGIIVLLACINCDDAVRSAYLETEEGGTILFPLPNPPPQAGEGTFEVTP